VGALYNILNGCRLQWMGAGVEQCVSAIPLLASYKLLAIMHASEYSFVPKFDDNQE